MMSHNFLYLVGTLVPFILSTSECIPLPHPCAYSGFRRIAIGAIRIKLNASSVLSLTVNFGSNGLHSVISHKSPSYFHFFLIQISM